MKCPTASRYAYAELGTVGTRVCTGREALTPPRGARGASEGPAKGPAKDPLRTKDLSLLRAKVPDG